MSVRGSCQQICESCTCLSNPCPIFVYSHILGVCSLSIQGKSGKLTKYQGSKSGKQIKKYEGSAKGTKSAKDQKYTGSLDDGTFKVEGIIGEWSKVRRNDS